MQPIEKNDLLTVKEFAEAAGITQQAVYKRLNNSLSTFVVVVENKKFLKREALETLQPGEKNNQVEQQLNQVEQQLNNQVERNFDNMEKIIATLSKTIELLEGQLDTKDSQIKELNKLLEQAMNNTSQSHYIAAQAQKQIADSEAPEPQPEPKTGQNRGFWTRLFSKH